MWKEWWDAYGGRATGVALGLLLIVVYLISGFWDMLFCALIVGVCFWFGKLKDERRGPLIPWERLTEWVTDRFPRSR